MAEWRTVPFRRAALLLSCLVYALFGSPTPPQIGWPESLIACGLVLALAGGVIGAFQLRRARPGWALAGQALLLYGLSVPLCIGLAGGNDPVLILRDMIPFLFLMLPLFVAGWGGGEARPLTVAAGLIGLVFSARVVLPLVAKGGGAGGLIGFGVDPLYLSIASTVSFSAVLCLGGAGAVLYRRGMHPQTLACALSLGGLGLLPLMAMAVTLQRAGLALSGVAVLGLAALALYRSPRRAAGPVLLLALLILGVLPWLGELSSSLLLKQSLVGENNRLEEASTVLDLVGHSLFSTLFGKGWGATLADPAVGGVTVNFTHNILTAALLKTGLAGLLLLVLYLYGIASFLIEIFLKKPEIAAALAVPFVIDLTLYASFKSLDFGLILGLILLWVQKLHESPASCI